ncbi:arylsulfatase [Polaribacter sp.]|jgi:arylsulfatase A-like enzyme|nr:arylsulfatase [Polaribacter sp.]|tara:strand:- start:1238 stop:2926 length:1689 start_codon:yes stop_codon:yes gene_type:complete
MKLSNCIVIILFFTLLNFKSKENVEGNRPNILLIMADDLGFSDLGCFGSEIRTPNLDDLAKKGIRNTSFYTAPTCSPSRGMLLSGVDNHRNGYGTMEGDWAENQKGVKGYEGHLNFDVVTFPKLLQENGYHTSISGKWHQAFPVSKEEQWPDKRGFTRSFSLLPGGAGHYEDQQKLFSFYEKTWYVEDGKQVDKLPENFYSSDFYATKGMSYIDESIKEDKPFFNYLAFTAPHWPLQVPDDYIDLYKGSYDEGYEVLAQERMKKMKQLGIVPKHSKVPPLSPNVRPWKTLTAKEKKISSKTMEVYAAMVERLDANVGRVIKHLKDKGVYENTVIVFLADNGAEGNYIGSILKTQKWVDENFDNSLNNIGRKNSYAFTGPSWAQVSSLPFKWYKGFSTEGGVRCPSIISYGKWKGNVGKINNQILTIKDFAPTFLELAKIKHPGTEYKGRKIFQLDGTSMIEWLENKEELVHDIKKAHCWELYGRRGVRKGNWKAEWQDRPYGEDKWELYDLSTDISEQINLSKKKPKKLEELIKEWETYVLKYDVKLPSERVGYGPDEIYIK